MVLNLLAIAISALIACVATLAVSVMVSSRVRRLGLMGALRQQFSPAARFRSPYRG